MRTSETITELSKALAEFQESVEQPTKSANNPFFRSKYVPLENVIAAIKKKAHKLGLSYIQIPLNEENKVGIKTIISHSSGEYIEFDPFLLPVDKNTAQGAGSALTYARRYTLSAAFGIASDEDDDGNAASGNTPSTQNTNKKSAQPAKVTKEKIAKVHAMFKEYADIKGGNEDEIKEYMKEKADVRSISDATLVQVNNIIKTMQELIAKAKEGQKADDE
ncbi:ERF family protein [Listeria booriae]|uniref:ERF family protein n=1 Tax=Listeria booriae TaxID=1552123 RepID=A0A7X1CBH8_9LIST|nr:ERF family protein [Listeria booriae]MBC1491433.1 ERF family protein [Listeria booriae]MBC1525459.1 ERF family protein [Listeria booriae]MBC6150081.1 ERF family protein [Listeria booriae]